MAEEHRNCLSFNGVVQPPLSTQGSGVVSEALNHPCIEEVHGGMNGALGCKERLWTLAEESQQNIELRYTPASALGMSTAQRPEQERILRFLKLIISDTFFIAEEMIPKILRTKFPNLLKAKLPTSSDWSSKTIDNDGYNRSPSWLWECGQICFTVIKETALDHEAMVSMTRLNC